MSLALSTLTPPAEPVLRANNPVLREQLRIYDSDASEDGFVDDLIARATEYVQTYTRRRLITQTVRIRRDGFGAGALVLPIGPVQSVERLAYVAGDGSEVEVASGDYRLVQSSEPARLAPAYGRHWPVPRTGSDTVIVDLVVGYGAAFADVPADLRGALVDLVALRFDARHGVNFKIGNAGQFAADINARLAPFIVWF